jgi:hypothetical protein
MKDKRCLEGERRHERAQSLCKSTPFEHAGGWKDVPAGFAV